MGPSLLLWAGPSMLFRGQCPPVALPHPALAHLLAPLLLLKQVLASVAGPEQRLATQHLHLGDPAGIHGTSRVRTVLQARRNRIEAQHRITRMLRGRTSAIARWQR